MMPVIPAPDHSGAPSFTDTTMPPKKRKKTGPPPKPEAEKARLRSTTLPPAVDDWLQQIGAGSVSRGMRVILTREYERTTTAK